MRKFVLVAFCSLFFMGVAIAQEDSVSVKKATLSKNGETAQRLAEIKFDTLAHNFGVFSEESPKVSHRFVFTNVGSEPLVINQVFASCGCTRPDYTKTPIKPGESGEISVTYNGEGRLPGKFRKTITVRSNAKNEVVRLRIEGDMKEKGK